MYGATGMMKILSWEELKEVSNKLPSPDLVNGPNTSQATLRLFGRPEDEVRVTLFRDHHAWCPYCQKVWMFLEEKQIPYRVRKVTMFCYGEKEAWYKKICPNGMLPALTLDDKLITESDRIIASLEGAFGPLGTPFEDPGVRQLRRLERQLFSAWCYWLCQPSRSSEEEERGKQNFIRQAMRMEDALGQTSGPFFLDSFSVVDCVFLPYVERMNASLFYYKGFTLRDARVFPRITAWFEGLEARQTYRGTQSDFHTHCHDLPPQMGGCFEREDDDEQASCKHRVDSCTDFEIPESGIQETNTDRLAALSRFIRHKDSILEANPVKSQDLDAAFRTALSWMVKDEHNGCEKGQDRIPPVTPGTEVGLRYVRDRINVPRDMGLWSARRLRQALEVVAKTSGSTKQGPPIPEEHRRDQDPSRFKKG